MERDSDRQKQMEGHCSTGQGSQRAVVPMEEEEEEEVKQPSEIFLILRRAKRDVIIKVHQSPYKVPVIFVRF